jgi:excinuclease ABC subunit B
LDAVVQALAGRQHGVVAQWQLAAAGLSRQAIHRRVEAGWLIRLHRGVYAVGHMALTRHSHLIAAVYACGPEALASHRAAAWLWGVLRGSHPIEVTAPRGRKPKTGFIMHRSRCIHEEDRALVQGIPVTSLARTIVDLADDLPDRRLADAVNEAEVQRLFDLKAVERVQARLPGRRGRHKLNNGWAPRRSTSTGQNKAWSSSSTVACIAPHAPSTRTEVATAPWLPGASTWFAPRTGTSQRRWPRSSRRSFPSAGPANVIKFVPEFKVNPAYNAVADQPAATAGLAEGIKGDARFQTLLGVTGSGKTATMAFTIEQIQRPALVIAHNKTLAAQLCNEFREFFPSNAVEYFVSYYDYYQPEAYVPSQDLYIEKDSSVNEEIDRLRHSATSALFARRDVIVVASVSCIFGLGSPQKYNDQVTLLKRGEMTDRDEILRKLVENMYTRNDAALSRGTFRVKGDTLEVFPAYAESAYRAVFFGDEVEQIQHFDPLTGEIIQELEHVGVWPATHYATDRDTLEGTIAAIRDELEWRTKELEHQGKLLESHRLRQRTQFDMEMLRELGYCNGIENYSRFLDGRAPGERPYCLLDFFPDDFVVFIDESHQTVPQIGGMYEGDRSRKQTLVDYGFRLPSALDNRPQTFDEFLQHTGKIVFVSATPGEFEHNHSSTIVEQIVRPTGIVDPEVDVRETRNQIDDLMEEIRKRVESEERTLVTTLTKKMAEDLTDYLLEYGFKVRYLHSEIDTLDRIQIIRELRLGEFDVLVGVNLLREGLDLPEVSLVAILDADKEGFLRGETSLIQTIGRAARNVRGTVIMYADKETAAMRSAIEETNRRRAIQVAYNEEHGITPATIQKGISDITDFLMMESKVPTGRGRRRRDVEGMSAEEIRRTIVELEEEMLAAADDLRFEYAAKLRDEIKALRRELEEAEAEAGA